MQDLLTTTTLGREDALAILDIQPVNHGHVLVLPKAEAATLSDLPDEAAGRRASGCQPGL